MPVRLRRSTKATFSCRLQATRFSVGSVSAAGSLARRIGATGERMGVSAYGRVGETYRRVGVSACRWTFGDEKRPIAGLEDLAPPGFIQAFNGSVWLGRISEAIENVGVNSRAGQPGVLTLQILSLRPPTPAHTPIRPYAHRRYADYVPPVTPIRCSLTPATC